MEWILLETCENKINMLRSQQEKLLILTKTYPAPSAKNREITCVAALNHNNEMRRLFPVPFRLLDGKHQFQKWEWIEATISRAINDKRPESFRIDVDSIVRTGVRIDTKFAWAERRKFIAPHIMDCFIDLETRRQKTGQTLGFVHVSDLLGLDMFPAREKNWTRKDEVKLMQDGLFDSPSVRSRPPLRKLPYDFYYRYLCGTLDPKEEWIHKVTDWEVGALFWNCYHKYGVDWVNPFRQKLEDEFSQKDIYFLLGTIHRFPNQWLIVGLFYPPKQVKARSKQLAFEI